MDVVGVEAVAGGAVTTLINCSTVETSSATPSTSTCILTTSLTTLQSPTKLAAAAVVGSEKISLPWDNSSTELCRSCGKPQTELYELFENNSSAGDDIDETNQNVIIDSSGGIVENQSVSSSHNSKINAVIEDEQKTKMEIILREMQIWQLRIKQDDGYPQRICPKCTAQFLMIGKFRRKCLKVQIRLRALNEERRLEEEQQLLKRLDDKETLDIPPVLDIGNDLINDNYGQPLSEVELFETNWNATETTQNESLTNELLVNDPVKAVRHDNDDVDDELRTTDADNITMGCRVLHHNIDLEVKANIDEESLLDTNSLFKTNIDKQTLEDGSEAQSQEKAQTDDHATLEDNKIDTNLVKNIDNELNASYFVENTLDMLAANQSNDFALSESDNNLTKNAVEMISIENLSKIDLVPTTSSDEIANNLKILAENDSIETKYDQKEDYNMKSNNDEKAQNKNVLENTPTVEKQNPEQLEISKNKAATNAAENILIKGIKSALPTTPNDLKFTSDDCCLKTIVEMRKTERRHSDTTFVTKAALKEYDSNLCNLKKNDQISTSNKSLQLPVKVSKSTTVCFEKKSEAAAADNSEVNLSAERNDKALGENPKPALIIPYAQKRRKKFTFKQMRKPTANDLDEEMETESMQAESYATKIRECTVRLRRLKAKKLNSLLYDSTNDVSSTNVLSPQRNELRKRRRMSNTDVNKDVTIKTQQVTETAELNTAVQKMESKNTPKNRLSPWRTKAEMKATIDNVKLRRESLRRKKAKTENETDTMMVTSAKDNDEIVDQAKVANLEQIPNVDIEQPMTSQEAADNVNKNMDNAAVVCTEQSQAKQQLKHFILRRRRHVSVHDAEDGTNVNKIPKEKLETNVDTIVQSNTLPQDTESQVINVKSAAVSKKPHSKSPNLHRKKAMQVQRWRLGLRRAKTESAIKNEVAGITKVNEKDNAAKDEEKEVDCSTSNPEAKGKDEPSLQSPQKITMLLQSPQKITELQKVVEQAITTQEHQIKSLMLRTRNAEETSRRRTGLLRTIKRTDDIPVEDETKKQLAAVLDTIDSKQVEFTGKEIICKEKNSNNLATQEITEHLPISQVTAEQLIIEELKMPQTISKTVEKATSSTEAAKHKKVQVNDLIGSTVEHETNPNLIETNALIIRVPLTALTVEFQRLHCLATNVQQLQHTVEAKGTTATYTLNSCNANEAENTAHTFIKSNFCESAAAAECSENAGALTTDISMRATNSSDENDEMHNPNATLCSQNESDLSECYGFASDHSFEINSVGKDDEENEIETENVIRLVSTQITDYINDFQTNCLNSNDIDDKSNTFPYDETTSVVNTSSEIKDEQNLNMTQIQAVRDINAHLSSNVSENDMESTLNGILNEIQDQHIFSSNTTLVTLESEDYHNHSAYSPLSDEPSELQINRNDFLVKTMKNTLCDSADSTGPVVNPRQVEGNTDVNHSIITDSSYESHFSKFVECFTEDSTQSELIGFQNDIPCFENIEMNSSTPRQNPLTPTLQMSQSSTPTLVATPLRISNSALQGAIQHGKNIELSFKNSEGNVQYLGITTNECDMSDAMGLVCSTSSGVQLHTPTVTNSSGQTLSATFVNEQQANTIAKEYAVDSATMQLSQLFTEMQQQQQQMKVSQTQDANIASGSSQDMRAIFLSDKKKPTTVSPPLRSTQNSVLSKFVGSPKRLVYSKAAAEAVAVDNAMLQQTKKKLQFITFPNDGQSTSTIASAPTETVQTLNIGNTYTEMLPDVQWQQTNAQDQQTTYYINTADLQQQSNLISALVSGNISLVPSQMSKTGGAPQSTTSIIHTQQKANDTDKQSVDANENYIEGMQQNQSIMIVLPQQLFKDSATVTSVSDYNSSQNMTTITTFPVLNATSSPTQSNAVVNTSSPVSTHSSSVPPSSSPASAVEQMLSSVNLTCRFCHKRPKFTNNLEYSNHIIAAHPAENPYNCPSCPMFFTRRVQRQQHVVEAHSAHRFQCAQCGQSFTVQRALDLHLQRYHVPDAPPQNLPKPRRKRLTREQKLQQQQQILDATPSCSAHQQQQQQVQKLVAAQSHYINPTSTWQDNASAQVNLEDVHLQVTDDDITINEADNVRTTTTTQNLNTPPHRILGCPECDDSFDETTGTESHTHHVHSPPATMPSPEQTEPDSTSTMTLRQFRKQRLSSKSFDDTPERVLLSSHNCMFCEERFTNEIALRKHHQMAHNNQPALPFVCSMCKRGFRMRTQLQRHMDTHDSEGRPYECNVCRVRFPRPSQLTLHKLTVHFLKKPQKSHTCNVCGRQFASESALKTHAKFHGAKQVDCSKCDKKFIFKKDFRKHWRIHTRELFYKCDICPKSFLHYTRLSAHLKTHIPSGAYIEEDPPAHHIREQKKQQQQKQQQATVEQSTAEKLNNSDVDNPQIRS